MFRGGSSSATAVTSAAFPLLAPNGTAAVPSYSFAGAPSTGFYAVANSLGLTSAGQLIISTSSSALAFGVSSGTIDIGFPGNSPRRLYLDYTNTGTVGAVTINKAAGRVNIAAAGTSVVVTNSLCTAATHVMATISQNDATALLKNVVAAAGSFTITLNAAATANCSVDFFLVNAD